MSRMCRITWFCGVSPNLRSESDSFTRAGNRIPSVTIRARRITVLSHSSRSLRRVARYSSVFLQNASDSFTHSPPGRMEKHAGAVRFGARCMVNGNFEFSTLARAYSVKLRGLLCDDLSRTREAIKRRRGGHVRIRSDHPEFWLLEYSTRSRC